MASLSPVLSKSIIKNFEIAARYGNYTSPDNSLFGTQDNSFALGLNYWLNWRTVIRYTYEAINGTSRVSTNLDGTPGATTKSNSMYLQFSIQL